MMTPNELKTLSDNTFFDNDEGLIDPPSHRAFNNSMIGYIQSGQAATYVVDSDAALNAWANCTAGNDYSHVLIRPGRFTTNTTIDLSEAVTYTVIGMGGSKIMSSAPIGMKGELNSRSYLVMGVEIEVSSINSVAFYQIANLIGCSGICRAGDGTTPVDVTNTYAFRYCDFLLNCCGYGFIASGNGISFGNCQNLTNCYGYCSATGDGAALTFSSCSNLVNCKGETIATDVSNAFSYSVRLTNCIGSTRSTNAQAIGFTGCYEMTNCIGNGKGATEGFGFQYCKRMLLCKSEGGNSGTVNGAFSSCYMNKSGTINPVGDTAAGGYNTP